MNDDKSRLGTEKISKLILSLAVPSIVAQLINVLYNIVDRIYIGHIENIGNIALTGVGVTFPIITLISAFSCFVGMGGAPLASMNFGRGDKDKSEKILGNSVTMLLFFSVVLTTFFMIFKEPLLYMFGASEQSIYYAQKYITIYLCGTLFVQLSLGLNTFISAQGNAKTAMLSVLIGALTNIILDFVFIFILKFGVEGAAYATVISQFLSALWVVKFLLSEKSIFRIKKKNIKPQFNIIKSISALGISPFVMQSTESLVMIVLNSGLQKYGNDIYVGSMTIMTSVLQLVVTPINGFNQGVQTILSYNYGAENKDRVIKTFKIIFCTSLSISCICGFLTCMFPSFFVGLFSKNEELINVTSKMMPIYLGGIWAFGAQMACQSTFLGLGQAKISLFLALLRKIILLIPLAIILPKFFGVNGIYYSEPIADITAAATTSIVFLLTFKKILNK